MTVLSFVSIPVEESSRRMALLPVSAKYKSLSKKAMPAPCPELPMSRATPNAAPSVEPQARGVPTTVETRDEARSSFLITQVLVSNQYRETPSGPSVMLVGQLRRAPEAGPSGDQPGIPMVPAMVETL